MCIRATTSGRGDPVHDAPGHGPDKTLGIHAARRPKMAAVIETMVEVNFPDERMSRPTGRAP